MSDTLIFTPATMPYGYGKGSLTHKILTSTDGTTFACGGDGNGVPCPDNYTAATFGSVMAHRSGQHGQRKARNAELKATTTPDLGSLRRRAEALLADIDKVQAQITEHHEDPYKAKYHATKRELDRIKRAFAGLVG
jgi:hypothetical protein